MKAEYPDIKRSVVRTIATLYLAAGISLSSVVATNDSRTDSIEAPIKYVAITAIWPFIGVVHFLHAMLGFPQSKNTNKDA